MRNIEVAAVDDRLFAVKLGKVRAQSVLELHAVVDSFKFILRIRHIAAYKVKIFILAGDNASLIKVSTVYAVFDR